MDREWGKVGKLQCTIILHTIKHTHTSVVDLVKYTLFDDVLQSCSGLLSDDRGRPGHVIK